MWPIVQLATALVNLATVLVGHEKAKDILTKKVVQDANATADELSRKKYGR